MNVFQNEAQRLPGSQRLKELAESGQILRLQSLRVEEFDPFQGFILKAQ